MMHLKMGATSFKPSAFLSSSLLITIVLHASSTVNARLYETSSSYQTRAAAAAADFYVLSMSYQPEFCYGHDRHQSFPGCQEPLDFWKTSLTLHGLWPQYSNGGWPSACSNNNNNAALDTNVWQDVGLDRLEKYWPNVKEDQHHLFSQYTQFWQHEWAKHGTCSGMTPQRYFGQALDHFLPTPSVVGEYYGKREGLSKRTLIQSYGGPGKVVTICSFGKYLTEIRACLGRNATDGTALGRMACPESVLVEDNCGETIVMAAFLSDKEWKVMR